MAKHLMLPVLLFVPFLLLVQFCDLSGSVKNPKGSAIPNASIELRDENSGQRAKAVSDRSGGFMFHHLTPGLYQATVQAHGYKTLTRDGIQLGKQQQVHLDLTLEACSRSPGKGR